MKYNYSKYNFLLRKLNRKAHICEMCVKCVNIYVAVTLKTSIITLKNHQSNFFIHYFHSDNIVVLHMQLDFYAPSVYANIRSIFNSKNH